MNLLRLIDLCGRDKPYRAFYIYKNNKYLFGNKKITKKKYFKYRARKVITNNNDDVMVKCYDCFLWS